MDTAQQRSIAERAEKQLSHITRHQLDELGLNGRQIRRLVVHGRLQVVGDQTFRISGAAVTYDGSVMAACLDTGGVASHRTAARLHGLAGFDGYRGIEVMARSGHHDARSEQWTVHRTTSLPADDITLVRGVPTTSVARTILGLAALPEVSDDRLRDTIDAATRDGLASDTWLWWHLEARRCRGRTGVIRMEGALQARAGGEATESWLERAFLRCIDDAGLARPTVQRRVKAHKAFVARVDFLYDAEWLIIEVKGHRFHSTRRQLAADAARENRIQLAGYRLLQFTYDDVVRRPGRMIETVMQALGQRLAS